MPKKLNQLKQLQSRGTALDFMICNTFPSAVSLKCVEKESAHRGVYFSRENDDFRGLEEISEFRDIVKVSYTRELG